MLLKIQLNIVVVLLSKLINNLYVNLINQSPECKTGNSIGHFDEDGKENDIYSLYIV